MQCRLEVAAELQQRWHRTVQISGVWTILLGQISMARSPFSTTVVSNIEIRELVAQLQLTAVAHPHKDAVIKLNIRPVLQAV